MAIKHVIDIHRHGSYFHAQSSDVAAPPATCRKIAAPGACVLTPTDRSVVTAWAGIAARPARPCQRCDPGVSAERQLFRVAVEGLLLREFGAEVGNDPAFQQMGDWICGCLDEEPHTREMLRKFIDS
jgi:hypothetical protein